MWAGAEVGREQFLRETGQVDWSGPGWQGRGGDVGHLMPLLSLEGRAAKEESIFLRRMWCKLRHEASAIVQKAGSVSTHVFLQKSRLHFMCLLRSLSMVSECVPLTLDDLRHFPETGVCINKE